MKRWLGEALKKRKVPRAFIPGLLAAMAMGWGANELWDVNNFYEIKSVFPETAIVEGVIDGDNVYTETGQSIRLIGINAPERDEARFDEAKNKLASLAVNKQVWLEYDRYQDDKFGRVLAWLWVDCEGKPQFLPADYMHLNKRQSRPGLVANPQGCQQGKLVNELMVNSGLAKVETYQDRGELKYEARLRE
jgi:endonuclease YncB( thermonuclease family)